MNREEAKQRFDLVPVLDKLPNSKMVEELHDVLKHPGLYHLWSLMLGTRQGLFVMLSDCPAGNTAEIKRLGVIQGSIKGIELFRETALEQCMSDEAPIEGAKA